LELLASGYYRFQWPLILGVDGVADFNALHSRKHDDEVQLYAFDILVEGDDDLRKLPLHLPRPTSNACWRVGPRASSSTRSSAARSGLPYSAPHATWGWRASCRSGEIDLIRRAGRSIG
jgi:hypothetical protein